MNMNISRYWFASFFILTFVVGGLVTTNIYIYNYIYIASGGARVVQSECKNMKGTIENFEFRGKMQKNKKCWMIKNKKSKGQKCKIGAVKNHCMKLCNNCPFPSPSTYFGLLSIKSSKKEWDKKDAFNEVKTDLERLGSRFYSEEEIEYEQKLTDSINDYAVNRTKVLKYAAIKCRDYAEMLASFPDISDKLRDELYGSMMKLALAINATYVETEAYIEGVQMRGWPFKIGADIPEFEAYQGGHVMEALALTAEQAALHGEMQIARSLALTVAGALYDGFLTKDLNRTKVRYDGKVVYVPQSAPSGRKERFRKIYEVKSKRAIYQCPEQSQAINHGLSAASAAVGLIRAFGAIGWLNPSNKAVSSWELLDADGNQIEQMNYVDPLKEFVSASAGVLIKMCKISKTGANPNKDNYSGPNGTEFYIWKYRKISKALCPSFDDDASNRYEDIDHAKVELRFTSIVRAVGNDYFGGDSNYFGISKKDVHRFLISVLNRFIINSEVKVNERFTCDLRGESDPLSKACSNARAFPGRISHVTDLLSIANAARDNPDARCDALALVNAVLPISLEGNKDFHGRFSFYEKSLFTSRFIPLMTKYNFYFYEDGVTNCQEG